jgi:hypothetical protein
MTDAHVPREFLGQARLFCERIKIATQCASAAVKQIASDAHAVVERRPRWRPEHFMGFEQQWRRTMPAEGRIGRVTNRGKRELLISETRLAFSNYKDIRWSRPELELSVALGRYSLQLSTPAAYRTGRSVLAIIGIHAIARWYERASDKTNEAIAGDIAELALHFPRLCDGNNEAFALPCISGRWVGAFELAAVSDGPDQLILYVRSFLPRRG